MKLNELVKRTKKNMGKLSKKETTFLTSFVNKAIDDSIKDLAFQARFSELLEKQLAKRFGAKK